MTDAEGHIIGFLDEADVGKAYLDRTRATLHALSTPLPVTSAERR